MVHHGTRRKRLVTRLLLGLAQPANHVGHAQRKDDEVIKLEEVFNKLLQQEKGL